MAFSENNLYILKIAFNVTKKNTYLLFPIYLLAILLLYSFKEDLHYLIFGVGFYISSYLWGILNLQTNYLFGIKRPQFASSLISILPPLITLCCVGICMFFEFKSLYLLCLIYILSLIVPSMYFSINYQNSDILKENVKHGNLKNELISEAKKLHLPSILSLINIWVPTIILGIVSSNNDVAIFNSANKISIIFIFVSTSINSIISPKIAINYKKNKNKLTAFYLALKGSAFAIFISAGPLFFLYLYANKIMGIFSPEFIQHSAILKILLFGQISTILLGGFGHLLIMTDRETSYKKAMIVSFLLSFLIILLLSSKYNLIGCAIGTAIGFWLSNIIILLLFLKN